MKEPWADVWSRNRFKVGPDVRHRIERLNPDGREPGLRPRGWHPSATLIRDWSRDLVGPKQFIAEFGRAEYRKAIAGGWFFRQGHRKAMMAENFEDHAWRGSRMVVNSSP